MAHLVYHRLRGLPCPRPPACMRLVCSASALAAGPRRYRLWNDAAPPVALSFRHPAFPCGCTQTCGGVAPSSAGGGAPLPPPAGARLALIVPPPAPPVCNQYLCMPPSCASSSYLVRFIALGLLWLFAPHGRVALVGLLGPVCCRARQCPPLGESGRGLRPRFLSACAWFCGVSCQWFPYGAVAHSLPIVMPSRMLDGSRPYFSAGAQTEHHYIITLRRSGALPP